MKLSLKYLVLTTLVLTILIGLANAQPLPITQTPQADPVEFSPTALALVGFTATQVPTATAPFMYDGDMVSACGVKTFTSFATTPATASLELSGFITPVIPAYSPGWVEIKIKLDYPSFATTNADSFKIEYAVGASAYAPLISNTLLNSALVAQIRPFSQLANPGGAGWTWADIAALKVKFTFTKGGTTWDGKTFDIYEVFATVHDGAAPSYAAPTLSVQPRNVASLDPAAPPLIMVEVYASSFTALWGYQWRIIFDTTVLTPMEAWTFYPFTTQAVPDQLDDVNGFVELAYYTFAGDPNGFTGSQPISRVYFMLDQANNAGSSPLHFSVIIMSDPIGTQIVTNGVDGGYNFGAVPEFPLGLGLIVLLAPLVSVAYLWRTKRRVIKQ